MEETGSMGGKWTEQNVRVSVRKLPAHTYIYTHRAHSKYRQVFHLCGLSDSAIHMDRNPSLADAIQSIPPSPKNPVVFFCCVKTGKLVQSA